MEKDRKTLIADAAIELLGTLGARGLTHRAVDTQAELPAGSTSFYCRTRLDLLALTLRRHAALDLADLELDAQRMTQAPLSANGLVDLLIARVADWLSPPKRNRLVARFELFLMASREPELAEIIAQQRQYFLQATEAALTHAGVADPKVMAPAVVVLVDGMLLDQVRANGPVSTARHQKAALKKLLVSVAARA